MPDPLPLSSTAHLGEAYALACALLWAIAVILFRRTGETVTPIALNLFKGVVGLAGFALTLAILGIPFLPEGTRTADAIVLFLSGMVGIGIADTLFFAGLNRIGAGLSVIVGCLYCPFVILCSALWLKEPATPRLFLSLGLMITAILVGTVEPGDLKRAAHADQARTRTGALLSALSVILMAIAIVWAKPSLDRADPWWSSAVRMAGGVCFLSVQACLPGNRKGVVAAFTPGRHWRPMVPSAVIGAYFAMFCWISGMKYAQTNTASLLNQTSTLFTLVLAAIFLGERFTMRRAFALGVGLVGVLLVL